MNVGRTTAAKSLSKSVLWIMSVFAALSIGAMGFLLHKASVETDRATLSRQHELVRNGVDEQIIEISHDQESVTFWDDAVLKAQEGDTTWLHENLGEWMFDYFGHDQTAVISLASDIVYAMKSGEEVSASVAAPALSQIEPMIADLRQKLVAPDRGDTVNVRNMAVIDGRPAIVSLMPIMPHSDRVSVEPGDENVFVSFQYLDGAFLTKLREDYLLSGARIALEKNNTTNETSVPIVAEGGRPIAHLIWKPELPGEKILTAVLPVGVVAGAALLTLIGFFTRYVYRASAAMQVSEARALHLAFHDTLTGLPNRALLVERIDAALKTRSDERVAVLFIDLDRFKEVNDTLGHHVGDELIREFVARLALHLRRSDTIGRLGGDEFAILLRHLQSEEEAFSFCERVLESGRAPFKIAGASSTVSVSIGLAWAVGGVDRHEMLRRADIALYAGKRAGRNCYRVFSPEMDEMVKEKRLIEEELRTALADRASGLAVHYQPQFGSRNGELQGVEALVRWDHPRLGAILPAAFVPVAEECGLIDELDAWVLRKACQDARGWSGTTLAVNVSPRSFDLPGLGERMLQVLREEEFDPHRLELEVTESILLEQHGGAAQDLQLLRSKGVRVALDDFGTGYSSLRNLQALTVDKIKIDRSFVQHLGQGVDSAAIVNAVIELGHALGLTVTAEGVETEAQREYLRAIGCDAVQGFLFTKAVPAWVISGELNELTKRGVA